MSTLHPALVGFTNPHPCEPGTGEQMTQQRLADRKKRQRQRAVDKREEKLRCPLCNDNFKYRAKVGRSWTWVCRHCLAPMR